MVLSYTGRLVCLTLCSAGLLLCVMEYGAWQIAPFLLKRSEATPARRTEQCLFYLALFARITPWVIVLGAWVPAYMRAEDNLAGERVGAWCCVGATTVAVWSALCCMRAIQAWLAGWRLRRQCSASSGHPNGIPVMLYAGARPVVAVVGVLRQHIIVSRSLLASEHFSAAFLDLALRHESAHVRRYDNLKLMVLSLLPHLPLETPKTASLTHQWRLATELAADEEGVAGRPQDSVLLAELLVRMARESNRLVPAGSFGLLGRSHDLKVRVERLLQVPQAQEKYSPLARQTAAFLLSAATILGLSYVLFRDLGHRAAEALLHLG